MYLYNAKFKWNRFIVQKWTRFIAWDLEVYFTISTTNQSFYRRTDLELHPLSVCTFSTRSRINKITATYFIIRRLNILFGDRNTGDFRDTYFKSYDVCSERVKVIANKSDVTKYSVWRNVQYYKSAFFCMVSTQNEECLFIHRYFILEWNGTETCAA